MTGYRGIMLEPQHLMLILLTWDAASVFCEKDAAQCVGTIHHRCCLPLRSNLSVVTLVEGNSGRENLKPLNEPQIKTGRRWQDVISLTLGPCLTGSGRNRRTRSPRKRGWADSYWSRVTHLPGATEEMDDTFNWETLYRNSFSLSYLENPPNLWLS